MVAKSRLVSLLLFSDSGVAVLIVVVPVGRPTAPLLLLLSVAEVDAVVPITMILCSRLFTNSCIGEVVLALVDAFKVVGWLASYKGTMCYRGSFGSVERGTSPDRQMSLLPPLQSTTVQPARVR